ncbi:endonuclease domain-containing protein [Brucella anthropi]|uniref:endonuclease domain-containing protein n=1 Tax=Brucella anthropi TaxID=529 RepID=UPI003D98FC44
MKKSKLYGFDLLRQQTIAAVLEGFEEIDEWVVGDSEIERLLCAALVNRVHYGVSEFREVLIPHNEAAAAGFFTEPEYRISLILQPQVQIEQFRVDFVLSAWTFGKFHVNHRRVDMPPHWRKLVIECDGHDFHERTKEQATKDRSRDRELSSLGYDVFRFTGSELWRDPWAATDQLLSWALRGW